MDNFINENFSKNAIQAIKTAMDVCVRVGDSSLMIEHIFVGILHVKEGIGAKILSRLGLDPDATIASIEHELAKRIDVNNQEQKVDVIQITLSENVKELLKKSYEVAAEMNHPYVGTEHILLALLKFSDNPFVQELNRLGITYERIQKEIEEFVTYPVYNRSDNNQSTENPDNPNNRQVPPVPNIPPFIPGIGNINPKALLNDMMKMFGGGQGGFGSEGSSFLETYGRNLTLEAKKGKLDPVIGREEEILRVMQVLARRTKNNPILLGDAGVGKTAVVEGLAQYLISEEASPVLSNFEIWSIDISSIIAGSQLRGDVEGKILELIKEVTSKGNIILFIDEIHTIMGAGATTNSSLDVANILKPALARGTLRCIGATTVDEYKQHFDNDPALQRRFMPVYIEEMSPEDTFAILKNLKPVYENYHNVQIEDSALWAAINLTNRFITDRYLPDKAIDVIDEACSKNKIERIKIPKKFRDLNAQLANVRLAKYDAEKNGDIDKAAEFLNQERELTKKIESEARKMEKRWNTKNKTITVKDIRNIIAKWSKVPLATVSDDVETLIKKLEKDLRENIIGQDHAVDLVINAIKRSKAGLAGYDRPLASFLFVGATGVGKTELAKQLAKSLFGSKEDLIQVDMSEFMESHSVSKLIGSPPGYVGYDQGGQLTDKVRENPFSVVLFDEIEKASPDVLNILLQILDEGKLTDSKGRTVNFKNTIIIMTSNIGAEFVSKDSKVGFYLKRKEDTKTNKYEKAMADVKERIVESLKEYLSPEFLNRIDDIVVFRELNKIDVEKITKLQLQNLANRLKKELKVVIKNYDSPKIIKATTKLGYSEEYGARELRRIITSMIETKIADFVIGKKWDPDSKSVLNIKLQVKNGSFIVSEA